MKGIKMKFKENQQLDETQGLIIRKRETVVYEVIEEDEVVLEETTPGLNINPDEMNTVDQSGEKSEDSVNSDSNGHTTADDSADDSTDDSADDSTDDSTDEEKQEIKEEKAE